MTGSASSGRPVPPQTTGIKCEFKAYHKTIKDGVLRSESVIDPFARQDNHSDDIKYALVVNDTSESRQHSKTELTINSPYILKALRDVVRSYEPAASDFTSPLTIQSPFGMLVHYWEELDEYRQTRSHSDERKHLDLLFKFMEYELKSDRDHVLEVDQKGQVGFENAWVIYRPGDILYREFMGEPWLLMCRKTVYETDPESGPYLEIHAAYTDHNGSIAGDATCVQRLSQRTLFPQDTPVAITELPIYPRRFVQAGDSLERRLRLRGEKFLGLRDGSTFKYNGVAEKLASTPFHFDDVLDPSSCEAWLPYTETGRVILDRKTFDEEKQISHPKIKPADPKPWLCPPFTLGYSLDRQQWVHLLVDKIDSVGWCPGIWDGLVLPEKEKSLLRSLVTSHPYAENPRDPTRRKNRGLVILLHGTPGSGKTLTVEAVAEVSHRALLSIPTGGLRHTSHTLSGSRALEKELKKILRYATIWQAIVLLDEADIFLEAREHNDAERNQLVATFLEELEYFSGIVFLTTSRVNTFDMAMKSRIHLALRYAPPEADARRQIWQHYLKLIPGAQFAIRTDEAVGRLAITELNGREIVNTINTACTVARSERRPLTLKHLDTVLEVRQAFDNQIMDGKCDARIVHDL
ncbi:P-loop containing nucleoside triphosphate hydrolase protein [Xylaria intraflava]|nr:P-loop containing nucleoside triphosphate hydrolase protein [Xylaria intraflava]